MKKKWCPVCKKVTKHERELVLIVCTEHDWRAERAYMIEQRKARKKNWEDQ